MKNGITNGITIEANSCSHEKRLAIRAALDYVYQEWNEPSPLCVIKVTNCFSFEYRKCHFEASDSNKLDDINAPNGITIPVIFQSDFYKKSVAENECYRDRPLILINNKKLCRASSVFFASVIVHELSHCRDYVKLLPQFQEKYNFNLIDARNDEWNNCIGGYFSNYSEAHAKYLQEKYWITHEYAENYEDFFFNEKIKRPGVNGIEKINDENDYYHASFCAGQLRCWEELFADSSRAMQEVKCIKEQFLGEDKHEEDELKKITSDMYEAFDWDTMIAKSDQIRKDHPL